VNNRLTLALIQELSDKIHADNVLAGWWTDINTNLSTLETRNRAELMLLVDSEVTEADQGLKENINDDKLPHLPMFNVELGDVAIRLFDMIGAENSLYGDQVSIDVEALNAEMMALFVEKPVATSDQWFLEIVNRMSKGMEHIRKGRTVQHRQELISGLVTTFAIAESCGFDLFDVIEQKRAFNASRADHKIENRLKDDGKKF
jgi:hypothetical protein